MEPMATGDPSGEWGDGALPPRVGARLRALREGAGLDLADIGSRTRIPVRHLEAIERSDYADLPAPTYAIGFARSYARAVGADEVEAARDVRAELGREPARRPDAPSYQPVDPARVPSRLLVWTTLAIAAVFLIGFLVLRNAWFADTPDTAPAARVPVASVGGPSVTAGAPGAGSAPAGGQVVVTATSPVWAEIKDAGGETYVTRELKQGESFTVPATADRPVLTTGRPNALRVTVDGREVPPLGPPERRISNVAISAAALAARAGVGQAGSAGSNGAQ